MGLFLDIGLHNSLAADQTAFFCRVPVELHVRLRRPTSLAKRTKRFQKRHCPTSIVIGARSWEPPKKVCAVLVGTKDRHAPLLGECGICALNVQKNRVLRPGVLEFGYGCFGWKFRGKPLDLLL